MRRLRHLHVVYVNGYGVPLNDADKNYERYLRTVASCISTLVDVGLHPLVVLAGGETNPNRPNMAESGFMKALFLRDYPHLAMSLEFRLLVGTSLDQNLQQFSWVMEENGIAQVTMFCEWARQDYFRYLAGQLIPGAEVCPVIFDRGRTPRWGVRLKKLCELPVRLWHHNYSARRSEREIIESLHS